MNKLLIAIAAVGIVGCTPPTKYIVKPELVEVKLPIPYCPSVEEFAPMEPIVLETLKLTEEDKKDPGKVARAYQIDMIALTQRVSELDRIDAIRKKQADDVRAEVDKNRDEVARVHAENMKKVQEAVATKQNDLNKK